MNDSPNNIVKTTPVEPKPAGAWSRFFAWLIDLLILPWLALVPLLILTVISRVISGSWESSLFTGMTVVIYLILYFAYSIYLTVNKGATWGKSAYGLAVVKFGTYDHISYKRAFVRELIRSLALVPIIGFFTDFVNVLVITFSSQKRGIHDLIAGTQVLKANNPWPMRKQLIIFGLMFIGGAIFLFLGQLFNRLTNSKFF